MEKEKVEWGKGAEVSGPWWRWLRGVKLGCLIRK